MASAVILQIKEYTLTGYIKYDWNFKVLFNYNIIFIQ